MSFDKVVLTVYNILLELLRQGDNWIMVAFMNTGYSLKEVLKLNMVRIHQQVIFLSDMFCAKGKVIDKRYQDPRDIDNAWLTLKFLHEAPTTVQFKLWNEVLKKITPMEKIIALVNCSWQDIRSRRAATTTIRMCCTTEKR